MKYFLWLGAGIGLIVGALLAGCTDADRAQLSSYGNPGHVTCYSGGKVIYDGWSDGKIATESQSDGWYFQEKNTKHLIRLSGDCVIVN